MSDGEVVLRPDLLHVCRCLAASERVGCLFVRSFLLCVCKLWHVIPFSRFMRSVSCFLVTVTYVRFTLGSIPPDGDWGDLDGTFTDTTVLLRPWAPAPLSFSFRLDVSSTDSILSQKGAAVNPLTYETSLLNPLSGTMIPVSYVQVPPLHAGTYLF